MSKKIAQEREETLSRELELREALRKAGYEINRLKRELRTAQWYLEQDGHKELAASIEALLVQSASDAPPANLPIKSQPHLENRR